MCDSSNSDTDIDGSIINSELKVTENFAPENNDKHGIDGAKSKTTRSRCNYTGTEIHFMG